MATSNQWNSDKLAEAGLALANGYGLGGMKPLAAGNSTSNRWTTNKLSQFGKALTRGYGIGMD
jgi:hypothetical protein